MFYYRIADITIGIDGDWPLLGRGRLRQYELTAEQASALKGVETCGNGGRAICDVVYDIRQECEEIDMPCAENTVEVNSRLWMKLANGGFAMVDRVPAFSEKIINRIVANADWSEIHVALCREDFCGLEGDKRAFYAFGETLPYVLFQHNGGVLHSSCISYRGQAVLFSAPSGTGKSTHTRLWKEFYPETVIINDDLPALRILPNKAGEEIPYAFGTPWAGKTQTNENISAPVRAVVFIRQAQENSIRRVSGSEAAFLIMQGVRKHVLEELMQASLDFAAGLLACVPAYELSCTISREAVELVRSELFGEEA